MPQSSKDRFGNVFFYGIVLCLAYLVFLVFQPFLAPLGWAAVFSVIFHPLFLRAESRFGRALAAWLTTSGVALILVVPVLLMARLFVGEGIQATRSIQGAMQAGGYGSLGRAWQWLSAHVAQQDSSIDLPGLVREGASQFGEYLALQLGSILRHIVVFLFELFVMIFALFFFLRDGEAIVERIRHLLPFEEALRERMLAEARDLIFASVTTSLVIAIVQGVLCGGAFAMVGLPSALFWGVAMAFLSLLPVVGAWPVWVSAAVWLFSTGHPGRAVVLIGICGGLGSIIDNILRPILLGGRSSLNGLLVFISVLGGIIVFGPLGIILGPVVIATAVGILDVYSGQDSRQRAAVVADS